MWKPEGKLWKIFHTTANPISSDSCCTKTTCNRFHASYPASPTKERKEIRTKAIKRQAQITNENSPTLRQITKPNLAITETLVDGSQNIESSARNATRIVCNRRGNGVASDSWYPSFNLPLLPHSQSNQRLIQWQKQWVSKPRSGRPDTTPNKDNYKSSPINFSYEERNVRKLTGEIGRECVRSND